MLTQISNYKSNSYKKIGLTWVNIATGIGATGGAVS